MHDRIEEVEVDGEKRIRAYGCVMGEVWRSLGKGGLAGCYCLVDPASSMAFNPEFKLIHIKKLPDGAPYCELAMRPTTEQDKTTFEADETDWEVIQEGSDQADHPGSTNPDTSADSHGEVLAWLQAHGREASSVVGRESGVPSQKAFGLVTPIDMNQVSLHAFDLSADSVEFPMGPDPEDAEGWTSLLFGKMKEVGAEVGVGRYDEVRQWYTSDIFLDPTSDPPEWRSVHIGVDLFLEARSPVLAPFDATVHSVANNIGALDYGPTVILEHQGQGGEGRSLRFWTLFGHLGEEEVIRLNPGQSLVRGEAFARIGDFPVNGNWAPHLHFQIITDLMGWKGNFPGVALPSQRSFWKALSPDPNLILGIPDLD
jgi:murein DD-endopeptidase MepM/ murein hydrolase activator NlpD